MNNFNRSGKSGRGRDFNKREFRGDRGTMYKATCAECGKECEIPFMPRAGRPVYCSDCFGKRRGDGENTGRANFENKGMFPATCAECGKACEVPFRPTEGKPVYCKNCFEKKGGRNEGAESGDLTNKHFNILNGKLDQLLKALGKPSANMPVSKKETAVTIKKAEKPVKEKSIPKVKTAKKIVVKKKAGKKG